MQGMFLVVKEGRKHAVADLGGAIQLRPDAGQPLVRLLVAVA
jgi:hypothetical protein